MKNISTMAVIFRYTYKKKIYNNNNKNKMMEKKMKNDEKNKQTTFEQHKVLDVIQ